MHLILNIIITSVEEDILPTGSLKHVNYCGYDLKYVLNKTFPQYKFDIIHVHVAIGNMEVLTLINLKVRCSFEMMYFLLFCSFIIEDGKYLAEQGKGKKSV